MSHLVAVVGPTGVGKSSVALKLAQQFCGEIVNADSRQIYRHMDIGTAKPTAEERVLVPHHLYDIADPDDDFGLALYQELACKAIEDIQRRQRLPLLVGGTGQYVWAVLEGWTIPRVPPDVGLRHELEAKAANAGVGELYRELLDIDPAAAGRIDPHNIRRVIRAIEVFRSTGRRFSDLRTKMNPPFKSLIIGLTSERQHLYRAVDRRTDEMVERGLVGEVEKLLRMGYNLNLPAMSSIGYQQVGNYLGGEMSLPEAVQKIKAANHRFIRHQDMWFRPHDSRICWFRITEDMAAIERVLAKFLITDRMEAETGTG